MTIIHVFLLLYFNNENFCDFTGGCCDCGDTEAWKSEPYCEVHLAGLQAKESSANKLPDDITERARATFQAVLKYCFDLLSLEHTPGEILII